MNKPNLKKIERTGNLRKVWLENEAKIQYRMTEDGIVQETFWPEDPHSVWGSTTVGRTDESLGEYTLGWIEWYLNAPLEEVEQDDFNQCLLGR